MFRVPTDVKAARAITINGQAYAKDARIQVDDLLAIAKRLHVFFSRGLLYASPDPHRRRVGVKKRQPVHLPAVMLNATLAQEVVQDAPAAPTALIATPGSTQASIAFTPGAAGAAAISNYQYQVDAGAWTAFAPTDTTSPVVVTGLTNGVQVAIKLRAVSAVGNGAASAAVNVTPA